MTPGPLIIVSGPSGSGKSTLIDRILPEFGNRLRYSISATTREKREGERDGVDYHFWTRDRFERGIANGEFLEFATVFGRHYYGTPRSEVEPYRAQGIGVILDIDVQGAEQLRRSCPDGFSIFLESPPGEYERRLRARGTDTEEAIQRRLATAGQELFRADEFDVRLMNDDMDRATDQLGAIIRRLLTRQQWEVSVFEDLKEEEIVNKVGGRFKLSTLIQKRMVALNTGAKPLVDNRGNDRMEIVLQEILEDKIFLDTSGELREREQQLPAAEATVDE